MRVTSLPTPASSVHDLGAYLRQQRQNANLSVRQLSALTGVSNPYLSQVERGLRRPSAEILQRLAQGLSVSAESLYVRAGLLDSAHGGRGPDVRTAIRLDGRLREDQRRALLRLYDGFVAAEETAFGTEDHPNSTLAKEHVMNSESTEQKEATAKKVVAEALTPVYAMVGASDLAVEKIRELGNRAAHDASATVDQLQERAESAGSDVTKAVKGLREDPKAVLKDIGQDIRQAPSTALGQAKDAVATSTKQASERAESASNDVTKAVKGLREDPKAVLKDIGQDIRQAPTAALNQALGAVAGGKKQIAELAERGKDVASKSRSKAAHSTEDARKAAMKTREAAVHQVDQVRDQVEHQAENVREGLSEARRRGSAAVSEGIKPIARRRRSTDKDRTAGESEAAAKSSGPSVAGAGVEAGSTTPVAKRAAKRTAAATRVSKKPALPKPAAAAAPESAPAENAPAGDAPKTDDNA